MTNYSGFKVAALAAAVALAMGSTAVMAAAPAATQLPGQGTLVTAGTASTTYTTGSTMNIALTGNTVIDWNKGTDLNKGGVAGFNIGSAATVNFTGSFGALNLDSTGNASQIFGTLTGVGNVFVANSNGIIVGAGASISSTGGDVGLISNALSPTVAADFLGGFASIGYDGTGGDVTVLPGATISGVNKVFISGGGTVNVDLGGVTGTEIHLSAGLPQAGGAFAGTNATAMLAVSDAAGNTDTPTSFASAGDASSSGALNLSGVNQIDGTFTNTGVLTLGAGFAIDGALVNTKTVNVLDAMSVGSLTNSGEFDFADYNVDGAFQVTTTAGGMSNDGKLVNLGRTNFNGGDFVNNGQIATSGLGLNVSDGNLVNNGVITGGSGVGVFGGNFTNNGSFAAANVYVLNGSIVNNNALNISGNNMNGIYVEVASDSTNPSFTKGADYSITNAGTITAVGALSVSANSDNWGTSSRNGGITNDSTGSVANTGTLQVGAGSGLQLQAYNDVNVGGALQVLAGSKYKTVSAANPLGWLNVFAGDYASDGITYTLGAVGVATVSTTVASTQVVLVAGSQVKLMNDISVVDGAGNPAGSVQINAGAQSATDYAVRVASGKTISAGSIFVNGDKAGDNPNMILQGTLSAYQMFLGNGVALSDVFSGPTGGLVVAGPYPYATLGFTGRVKAAPYLNDANFRFNYLPITNAGAAPLSLTLDPVAYTTNSTANGLGGVNVLVNGDVSLFNGVADPSRIDGVDSAVTGVTNIPNTHLVVQSTGNITANNYYWPGYVYLGNIVSDADGIAQPGTLGFGKITLNGNFSNVLPGSVEIGAGVHFMTQFPLQMNGYSVTTNANAWVNFGTELLTNAYASGTLGDGQFFGGVQGSGSVVNYKALDESMFHTHLPDATR